VQHDRRRDYGSGRHVDIVRERVRSPISDVELVGVDMTLSTIETAITALTARRMAPDQVDRYARLLQRAQRDCLGRAAAE
jgi:hypothetical protein